MTRAGQNLQLLWSPSEPVLVCSPTPLLNTTNQHHLERKDSFLQLVYIRLPRSVFIHPVCQKAYQYSSHWLRDKILGSDGPVPAAFVSHDAAPTAGSYDSRPPRAAVSETVPTSFITVHEVYP